MQYKIVDKSQNLTILTVPTKKEGDQFILGLGSDKTSSNLIVVPENYQWAYSYRHNGFRWMQRSYSVVNNM